MKRGIILFIVEGPSDQDALAPYITKRLDKLKRGLSIEVMHGDILTEYIENTKSFILNDLNSYIKNNFDVKDITKSLKKFLLLKYALVCTITLRNSLIIINNIETDLENELLSKYIEFLLKVQNQYPNRLIINTMDKNVVKIIREIEKKLNLKSKVTYYTVVQNKGDFTLNKKE